MIQVLPAIIEDTFAEVKRKIELVAPFVEWIQIDVADGKFAPRVTWTHVEDLDTLNDQHKGMKARRHKMCIDLHTMVEDPLGFIERVKDVECVRRVTFHYEAVSRHNRVIREIGEIGREIGMAVNPETMVESVTPLLAQLDAVLVMGVHPGYGGQRFIPETCDKIRALKAILPKGRLGVDGGIHLATGTAQAAVDAGADYLVVGSDIFNAQEPEGVIKKLKQLSPNLINPNDKFQMSNKAPRSNIQ